MPLVVVCIVVSFGKKNLLPVKEEAAAPHSHNEKKKREVEMALGVNRRILEKLGWETFLPSSQRCAGFSAW